MEKLEDNLISGVVNAEDPAREYAVPATPSPENDSESESENQLNTDTGVGVADSDNVTAAHKSYGDTGQLKDIVSEWLAETLGDIEQRLAKAEEEGFNRAVEMLRNANTAPRTVKSVPNFLADVRKDVWDV